MFNLLAYFLIIFIFSCISLLLLINNNHVEYYGSGALTQLFAKGPQDTYLTGDAWKYLTPWDYEYATPDGPWYIPTRNMYYYPFYYNAYY